MFPYQPGSTGPGVRGIQVDLKYRGYALTIDSNYGGDTTAAVVAFQHDANLAEDGVTGVHTAWHLQRKRTRIDSDMANLPRWVIRGIAGQESSWDYGAVGFSHPDDKGALQINISAPPAGPVTEEQAFDPEFAWHYCAGFLSDRHIEAKKAGFDETTALAIAICSWHAPAWGQEWEDTGSAPSDAASLYVSRVIEKGHLKL